MEFRIGRGLVIGGESKYCLAPPVEGLDHPDIRIGEGVYAGRDGGFVSGHFYGQRTIILNGFYIGANCEEADRLRRELFSYLRIRYTLPIFIVDFSGNNYYTEGYISDVKSNITGPVSGEYQLTLLCPDPIIYYGGDGISEATTWTTQELDPGINTVINGGSVDAWPSFSITGLIDGITVTNQTTTQSLTVDVQTSDPTDVVVINMQKRLITLNGEVINADRTIDSEWWYLLPGQNDIEVDVEDESGAGITAEIRYKKGYAGI